METSELPESHAIERSGAPRGPPSHSFWNDLALVVGSVIAFTWLPICWLRWLLAEFIYQPYPPASEIGGIWRAAMFSLIGWATAVSTELRHRARIEALLCACGMVWSVHVALAVCRLPFGYPDRGPHEFVVLATIACVALVLTFTVIVWRIPNQSVQRRVLAILAISA